MGKQTAKFSIRYFLSEDWLAVWISLVVILLAVLGIVGPQGLNITF